MDPERSGQKETSCFRNEVLPKNTSNSLERHGAKRRHQKQNSGS